MRGSTHLAGGLLAGAILSNSPFGLAAAGLAALAPDWLQINLPGANHIVRGLVGHRGLTHWLLAVGAVGLAVHQLAPDYGLYAVAGWASHLALDLLSGGMTLLWPVPTRITIANVKTGGKLDTLVGACLLVIAASLFIWRIL